MNSSNDNPSLAARVQVMQIIVGALAMGVASFLAVSFVIWNRPAQAQNNDVLPVLTFVSFGMLLMASVGSFVMPRLVLGGARKKMIAEGVTQDALLAAYQVKTIIACAMLEGAAFASILAYGMEGNVLCLAGAVVMLLGILVHMPTLSRVQNWLEVQTRQIELERQLGGR
jgi:hypothetical protein